MKKMALLLCTVSVFTCTLAQSNEKIPPVTIQGNWLDLQNNTWGYGFYEHFAMADGRFWQYKTIKQKKNKIILQLEGGAMHKKLIASLMADGNLKVTDLSGNSEVYTSKWKASPDYDNYDEVGFQQLFVKIDTFHLSGFIEGYDPSKNEYKFVNVIYNPLLEGEQKNLIAPLDSLGRFQIDFPLLNPQEIMLRCGDNPIQFFGIPGSRLTVCVKPEEINKASDGGDLLFAGPLGTLNTELHSFRSSLSKILPFSLNASKTKDLDADAYKQFRVEKMNEQLKEMEEYARKHHSSRKFIQQTGMYIQYSAGDDLLRYRWLHNSNIQDSLPYSYLSFLKQIPLNNDTGVITDEYSAFLREYLIMKRSVLTAHSFPSFNISVADLMKQMDEDERIDPEAKKLFHQLAGIQQEGDATAMAEFMAHDSASLKKYAAKYQSIFSGYAQKIADKKQSDVEEALRESFADTTDDNIGKDILLSILAYDEINKNKVLDDEAMAFYKKNIGASTLYKAVYDKNKALAEMLAGDMPAGAHIMTALKTAGDSVLEALVAPYKGKVVYIDFWAPWCGPCMGEMPSSISLQKEMSGKDVVFLYLGVQCSEASWKNTIKSKQLPGEHYLLNNNELSLLNNRFQITGIPHYILVDKNGKVADADAQRPSAGLAKKEITDLLK